MEIKKAAAVFPSVDEVDGGTYTDGMKLSSVPVPAAAGGTIAWKDGDSTSLNAGKNTVKAQFTPDKAENYSNVPVEGDVTVNITPATIADVSVQSVR